MAGQVSSLQHFQRMGAALTATALLAFAPSAAQAGAFVGLYQSSVTGAYNFATYDSQNDWIAGGVAKNQASQFAAENGYRIAGLSFDGSKYFMAMEANNGRAGAQFKFAQFDSLNDLTSGKVSFSDFSTQTLHPYYSTKGFVYDGSQFHMLIESDFVPNSGVRELYVRSFASFADLMSGTMIDQNQSAIKYHQHYRVDAFTYENGEYHVTVQYAGSKTDQSVLLHRMTFASISDLLNSNWLVRQNIQSGLGSEYRLIALADPPLDQLQEVPEPQTALMILASLFGLGYWAQRRRRLAVARRGPAA